MADQEEAIQTFGREQTYVAFVAIGHTCARKLNLKVIERLAHKFQNTPLETLMEVVLEAGL